ncbi:MAG: zinc ribbon domain-containing protein [bacterium]|nr:zinc ribbon domain-containing protein [bacterium]
MPIYEYECTSCHHHFDLMQKFSDEPVTLCPQCSENTVIKLISAAGFQLKGTGWYATDFKNKGNPTPSTGSDKKEATVKSESTTATSTSTSSDTSKSSKGTAE